MLCVPMKLRGELWRLFQWLLANTINQSPCLVCCIFHIYFPRRRIKFPSLFFFFLISHGNWKSYKLLKMLKITFVPAGDVFWFVFFSVSEPLLVMKHSLYVPLGSWVSPSASCIPGLLSVGVWFMRIKPLQTADYQIEFSECWQLKCCHMLMSLHHWKSELSVPRRHIRLLFVLCYPSGE